MVEFFSEFPEVLTVHFDDTDAQYLQLPAAAEGYEADDPGICVEVDDQSNVLDDFTRAELRRNTFRLSHPTGDIEITFDLDKPAFATLRHELERVFRTDTRLHVVAS